MIFLIKISLTNVRLEYLLSNDFIPKYGYLVQKKDNMQTIKMYKRLECNSLNNWYSVCN
jgi:hypothetical protein